MFPQQNILPNTTTALPSLIESPTDKSTDTTKNNNNNDQTDDSDDNDNNDDNIHHAYALLLVWDGTQYQLDY